MLCKAALATCACTLLLRLCERLTVVLFPECVGDLVEDMDCGGHTGLNVEMEGQCEYCFRSRMANTIVKERQIPVLNVLFFFSILHPLDLDGLRMHKEGCGIRVKMLMQFILNIELKECNLTNAITERIEFQTKNTFILSLQSCVKQS